MKTTETNSTRSDLNRAPRRRGEAGWVVLASMILVTIAASVTVTWARHALLAKGTLEMALGANSSEEASRSGLNRCREKMRQGQCPGVADDGEEDVVVTDEGYIVTTERGVDPAEHDRRSLRSHARQAAGTFEEEASLKGRARVVPGSHGNGNATRLKCDEASGVLAAGLLTIISTDTTVSDTEMAGLFLLDNAAVLTLNNVVLRGTIITRAGLCGDEPLKQGSGRPEVRLEEGVRLLSGTVLPGVAVLGPDLVMTSTNDSRVEVQGMVVADELDLSGRGCMRGMVVTETSGGVGIKMKRPGYGRGPESWSSKLDPGAENVTRIAFPAEGFTTDEMDVMEKYNAFGS
jgi:hypothetical protein